ncbi:MAG: hypothetical protein ACYC46_04955 [Acidobacteriaceae bacterium]
MDNDRQLTHPSDWRAESRWLLLVGLICAHFSLIYHWKNQPFLSLTKYAAGTERLPYQARVLMAWVFRYTIHIPLVVHISKHLPQQLSNPFQLVEVVVTFAALFGAILCTRGSLHFLTGNQAYSRWAGLLVAYMAYFNLPLIYGLSYTLPYDVPSLFFFCAGVFLILRRSSLYYLILLIGTFNRETTCFLILFFILWNWNQDKSNSMQGRIRVLALPVLLQTAIWIGVKLYLHHLFLFNAKGDVGSESAGLFGLHFLYNLHELVKPAQWPLLFSNFGFTLPLLITQRKWIKNSGIERTCSVLLPLWICLMLLVGVVVEIRIFTELIAFVAPAVALIVYNRWSVWAAVQPEAA